MTTKPGLRIGLSGAVPEPEVLRDHGASSADIHMTVRRLVERALAQGDWIVYGSHPTFTPIIEEVASRRLRPDLDPRVMMFVAVRYFSPVDWEDYHQRHARYAQVVPIGDFKTSVDYALRELRDQMVQHLDAMICIGGKLHRDQGNIKPGVLDEYERAVDRSPPIPIFLLGGFGGCTREIHERHEPQKVTNGLDAEERRRLGETAQVWDAVDLVFKGLGKLHTQAEARLIP